MVQNYMKYHKDRILHCFGFRYNLMKEKYYALYATTM